MKIGYIIANESLRLVEYVSIGETTNKTDKSASYFSAISTANVRALPECPEASTGTRAFYHYPSHLSIHENTGIINFSVDSTTATL